MRLYLYAYVTLSKIILRIYKLGIWNFCSSVLPVKLRQPYYVNMSFSVIQTNQVINIKTYKHLIDLNEIKCMYM